MQNPLAKRVPTSVMRVPFDEQGRDLLVGDVHGCLTKLLDDLSAISFDADVDRLFLLGDMIDRGDQCLETIAFTQEPFCFPLMGNHEFMLYACHNGFMEEVEYAGYGGQWYTALDATQSKIAGDWVMTLPVCIELQTRKGRIGLVHADCPYGSWPAFTDALQSSDNKRKEAMEFALWDRERIENQVRTNVSGVRALVVGHQPVAAPVMLGNVVYIDSGAWIDNGRNASCFCLLNADTLEPEHRLDWDAFGGAAGVLLQSPHRNEVYNDLNGDQEGANEFSPHHHHQERKNP